MRNEFISQDVDDDNRIRPCLTPSPGGAMLCLTKHSGPAPAVNANRTGPSSNPSGALSQYRQRPLFGELVRQSLAACGGRVLA